MDRRRQLIDDYNRVLRGSGDVTIGAYARAQRRRTLIVILSGLALIVAAVWLYFVLRPSDPVGPPSRFGTMVACVDPDCGYRGIVQVTPGEGGFPTICPKCGQRSCYKVWECRDCGRQFFLRSGSQVLRCPECGSQRVGAAEELPPPEPVEADDVE